MFSRPVSKTLSVITVTGILAACSVNSGSLNLSEQLDVIEDDIKTLFQDKKIEKPVTLYDAMAYALKYNMDHRLASAEEAVADGNLTLARLSMLPSLDLKSNYIGRNKESASSSRSVTTGVQSLEPSTSTDQHRRTASLEASWNMLDTGIAFVQSRQESNRSLIASERRRKVTHNIIQDVRYAYWRAVGAQEILGSIKHLVNKGNKTIRNIKKAEKSGVMSPEKSLQIQARLLSTMDELMTMRSQLSFARIELASLMNLPTSSDFKLKEDAKRSPFRMVAPDLGVSREDLETLALLVRPEVREESYQKKISTSDVRLAVLETFPGADLMFSQNYDGNTFLEDQNWRGFSFGLTQSLMKLFTLPARFEQAKAKEKLTDFKRQALTVAVMAQVHVADARFDLSKDRLKLIKRIHAVNTKMVKIARSKKIAETLNEGDLLEVEMGLLLSRVRAYLAFAEMQNSYGQVINSIGVDIIPEEAIEKNVDELAVVLEASMKDISNNSLKELVDFVEQTRAQSSVDNITVNVNYGRYTEGMVPFPLKKPGKGSVQDKSVPFMSFKGLFKTKQEYNS